MEELALWLSLALKIFTLYFACVAIFTLKKPKPYPHAAPSTRFAVVAPARNEEAVIGNLVESILNQKYPAHLRDVYVVPNNCTDFTEAAAAAHSPINSRIFGAYSFPIAYPASMAKSSFLKKTYRYSSATI